MFSPELRCPGEAGRKASPSLNQFQKLDGPLPLPAMSFLRCSCSLAGGDRAHLLLPSWESQGFSIRRSKNLLDYGVFHSEAENFLCIPRRIHTPVRPGGDLPFRSLGSRIRLAGRFRLPVCRKAGPGIRQQAGEKSCPVPHSCSGKGSGSTVPQFIVL